MDAPRCLFVFGQKQKHDGDEIHLVGKLDTLGIVGFVNRKALLGVWRNSSLSKTCRRGIIDQCST